MEVKHGIYLQQKYESRLTAVEMKFLRKIAGLTKWDHIRNVDIANQLQQERIIKKYENKILEWYGHVSRMQDNRIPKKIMEAKIIKKKKRGRPKKAWMEEVAKRSGLRGCSIRELREKAKDRKEYKKWIRKT